MDHFVPWARYPNNGIENLVLAQKPRNNVKRDHLAAAEHVDNWVRRSLLARHDLASIAQSRSWESHASRSLSVGRSIYLRLPDDPTGSSTHSTHGERRSSSSPETRRVTVVSTRG